MPIEMPIVFHVLAESDVDKILIVIAETEKKFESSRVSFPMYKIIFDVPMPIYNMDIEKDVDLFFNIVNEDHGYIHVFFVDSINSEDHGPLAGAETRRVLPCSKLILLTDLQSDDTLAHEIGHFFGLSHHKNVHNVMNGGSTRSDKHTSFSKKQREHMRNKMRHYNLICRSSEQRMQE